jgi:hypothetical protein
MGLRISVYGSPLERSPRCISGHVPSAAPPSAGDARVSEEEAGSGAGLSPESPEVDLEKDFLKEIMRTVDVLFK